MHTLMNPLTAFESAYSVYPATEMPFLQLQRKQMADKRPYAGLKILHNLPLTPEVLFKLEVLVASGAELTVTCPLCSEPNPLALKVLDAAGVKVQLSYDFVDDFDIALDCGGELLGRVTPRIGAAEMTRTGTIGYESTALSYPVISIDGSTIKSIESVLGTGDAFVRAFQVLTGESIQHKRFMVVGCGKVAQGIVHALKRHTDDLVIVDSRISAVEHAIAKGFSAIPASHAADVEAQVADCFAVVTATGREQIITQLFNPQVFKGRYLANMGDGDEFGDGFARDEVMGDKKPINVAIDKPMLMRYLDPVFYAHNMAIDLLLSSPWEPQVYPFPVEISSEVVTAWEHYFQESLRAVSLGKFSKLEHP